MKRFNIFFIAILLSGTAFGQLDVPFSQYLFNQNSINPAYNGIHDVLSLNFNARQQWVGVEGHPQSYMFNAHTSYMDNRVATGLTLQNDRYGITSINEVHLSYAYHIEIMDGKLSMGLQSGFVNFSNDYTLLNLDGADPNFPQVNETFTEPNFGAGIFFSQPNYFIGFSVPKMLDVEYIDGAEVSTRYKRHYYLSGGYLYDKYFHFKIRPAFLYRQVQDGVGTLDLNLTALINELYWVGFTVTDFGQAFGVNFNLEIDERYRAGFSGTLSGGTLQGGNVGTFEVMISMDLEMFNKQAAGNRYY